MAVADANLTSREADIHRQLEQLREQRQRLAPEAMTDRKAAAELERVEAEIQGQEQELERIGLAQTELSRRDDEATAEQRAQACAAALERVSALGEQRARAGRAVDAAAVKLAKALRDHHEASIEQGHALQALARVSTPHQARELRTLITRAPRIARYVADAIGAAMRSAGVGPEMLPFTYKSPVLVSARPLGEADPGRELAEEAAQI
jgi:hypothetical protein